jgi:hypothetical protein
MIDSELLGTLVLLVDFLLHLAPHSRELVVATVVFCFFPRVWFVSSRARL